MPDDRDNRGSNPHSSGDLFDDEPTERIVVNRETAPAIQGVLDPDIANQIRQEHEPTVQEALDLTFVVDVQADGTVQLPENLLRSGRVAPGMTLIIRARII